MMDLSSWKQLHSAPFRMNQAILITFLLLALSIISGCACVKTYLQQRAVDLSDTHRMAIGVGMGFKVRVGPCQTGIGVNTTGPAPNDSLPIDRDYVYITECKEDNRYNAFRGELYDVRHVGPFIALPDTDDKYDMVSYCTGIEAYAGLIFTLRAGVSLAEMADFLLGFVCVDFMKDDMQDSLDEKENDKAQSKALNWT